MASQRGPEPQQQASGQDSCKFTPDVTSPSFGGERQLKILFIHQNFPGQYRHIAPRMAAAGHEVIGLGEVANARRQLGLAAGVHVIGYRFAADSSKAEPFGANLLAALRRGNTVAQALAEIVRDRGFEPEVVCAHIGWGEAIFVKDVFPKTRLLLYGEYFYGPEGADYGFDPEFAPDKSALLRLRVMNAPLLMALEAADRVMAPTRWQASRFPAPFRPLVSVAHDGIDTERVRPNPAAVFEVPQAGLRLQAKDQVVTYTARNFEPYRGFHVFMRAVPIVLERCPNAKIVLVGNDAVSYSRRLPKGQTYRALALKELGAAVDPTRVFFFPKLPYEQYLSLLQISSAHVYLTYPFPLSWSLLEAMATGCLVIASRTAPVMEVVADGENGLLVDFHSPGQIADRVEEALRRGKELVAVRDRARETIVARYDLKHRCLPMQVELIKRLSGQ